MTLSEFKTFAIARSREPSTWRGFIWLATALGVSLDPAALEYLVTIGMAVAGLIGVLSGEKKAVG